MENNFKGLTLKGEVIERTIEFINSAEFIPFKETLRTMNREEIMQDEATIAALNELKGITNAEELYDIESIRSTRFEPIFKEPVRVPDELYKKFEEKFEEILNQSKFGYDMALMYLKQYPFDKLSDGFINVDLQEICTKIVTLQPDETHYYTITILEKIAEEKSIKGLAVDDILAALNADLEPVYAKYGLDVSNIIDINEQLVEAAHRQASIPDDFFYLRMVKDSDKAYEIDWLTKTEYADTFFPRSTPEERAKGIKYTYIFNKNQLHSIVELVHNIKGAEITLGFAILSNKGNGELGWSNEKHLDFTIYKEFEDQGYEKEMLKQLIASLEGSEIDTLSVWTRYVKAGDILVSAGFELIDSSTEDKDAENFLFEYNVVKEKGCTHDEHHACGCNSNCGK